MALLFFTGGHDSKFFNNLIYATNKHCFGTGSFRKGHADAFQNNSCIVVSTRNPSESKIGTLYQCSTEGMNPTSNSYFTESGNATWTCLPHSHDFPLEEMQAMGFEKGSTVQKVPGSEAIMSMAMKILNIDDDSVYE